MATVAIKKIFGVGRVITKPKYLLMTSAEAFTELYETNISVVTPNSHQAALFMHLIQTFRLFNSDL